MSEKVIQEEEIKRGRRESKSVLIYKDDINLRNKIWHS